MNVFCWCTECEPLNHENHGAPLAWMGRVFCLKTKKSGPPGGAWGFTWKVSRRYLWVLPEPMVPEDMIGAPQELARRAGRVYDVPTCR
jgi:hypothetical protein